MGFGRVTGTPRSPSTRTCLRRTYAGGSPTSRRPAHSSYQSSPGHATIRHSLPARCPRSVRGARHENHSPGNSSRPPSRSPTPSSAARTCTRLRPPPPSGKGRKAPPVLPKTFSGPRTSRNRARANARGSPQNVLRRRVRRRPLPGKLGPARFARAPLALHRPPPSDARDVAAPSPGKHCVSGCYSGATSPSDAGDAEAGAGEAGSRVGRSRVGDGSGAGLAGSGRPWSPPGRSPGSGGISLEG